MAITPPLPPARNRWSWMRHFSTETWAVSPLFTSPPFSPLLSSHLSVCPLLSPGACACPDILVPGFWESTWQSKPMLRTGTDYVSDRYRPPSVLPWGACDKSTTKQSRLENTGESELQPCLPVASHLPEDFRRRSRCRLEGSVIRGLIQGRQCSSVCVCVCACGWRWVTGAVGGGVFIESSHGSPPLPIIHTLMLRVANWTFTEGRSSAWPLHN